MVKRGKRKPESEMTELERLRAENKLLAAQNKRLETENAVLKLEEIEEVALNGVRQEYLYTCVLEMHKEGCAVTEICDILNLNRSSYYKWVHRVKSRSELENEVLLHDISMIYAEHNGTYGYCRIADEYNSTHEKKYNLKRTVWYISLICWQLFAESVLLTSGPRRKLRLKIS